MRRARRKAGRRQRAGALGARVAWWWSVRRDRDPRGADRLCLHDVCGSAIAPTSPGWPRRSRPAAGPGGVVDEVHGVVAEQVSDRPASFRWWPCSRCLRGRHGRHRVPQSDPLVQGGEHVQAQHSPERGLADQQAGERAGASISALVRSLIASSWAWPSRCASSTTSRGSLPRSPCSAAMRAAAWAASKADP